MSIYFHLFHSYSSLVIVIKSFRLSHETKLFDYLSELIIKVMRFIESLSFIYEVKTFFSLKELFVTFFAFHN